jgi:hypothetical protein
MVVTALAGFIVSAQFVSLEALEIPYFVTLLGAGTLRLLSLPQLTPARDEALDGDAFDDESPDDDDRAEEPEPADRAALAATLPD